MESCKKVDGNRYLLSEEETAIMCISNEQCQTRKKQHLAVYRQDAVSCGDGRANARRALRGRSM